MDLTSQVHQVPIVGHTVLGRVLTHRRHCDPVAKHHTTNGQWAEKIGFFRVAELLLRVSPALVWIADHRLSPEVPQRDREQARETFTQPGIEYISLITARRL
jgi:hypothetical protein